MRESASRQALPTGHGSSSEQLTLFAQLQPRGLPFRSEPYTLTLHVPALAPDSNANSSAITNSNDSSSGVGASGYAHHSSTAPPVASGLALHDTPHRLQQWFGLRAFLLLTPDSYSGRVLETEVGGAAPGCCTTM